MKKHIFVIGYPGSIGGADTECWHLAKLWRSLNISVTFIPTWNPRPAWQKKLDSIGCTTALSDAESLSQVPNLPGSTVVGICNGHFLKVAKQLRKLQCNLVWVNCMNWIFKEEVEFYQNFGTFDQYVFQSEYQRSQLERELKRYGYKVHQGRLIRGAFDVGEFDYKPKSRRKNEPFVFGRLSRTDPDKYAKNLWEVYSKILSPKQVRIMGWSRKIQLSRGIPPDWAQCLRAGAESSSDFLGSLHALIHLNGKARENWPRVGLEAMASGVPIIVQNRWGWREMIRHGKTGFLAETDEDVVKYANLLARDESLRLQIAETARTHVAQNLASPSKIGEHWLTLFNELK